MRPGSDIFRAMTLRTRKRASREDLGLTRGEFARLAKLDTPQKIQRYLNAVPSNHELDGETLYTAVDGKPKRSRRLRRIENARERPDVTVLVDHYEHDWTRLWWLRLRGRARVLDGGEEAERALAALTAKYPQYAVAPPGLPVLAVDVADRRAWAAADV